MTAREIMFKYESSPECELEKTLIRQRIDVYDICWAAISKHICDKKIANDWVDCEFTLSISVDTKQKGLSK